MFTPAAAVQSARVLLGLAVTGVAILMIGPFQGMEEVFGLSDKVAHALTFAGLTTLAFLAFPTRRRWDMALMIVSIGGLMEVIQVFAGRDAELGDLLADLAGVGMIYFPSQIEPIRKLARERGEESFAAIKASDRRSRSTSSKNSGWEGTLTEVASRGHFD